jgi:hypothetical protein
MKILRRRHAPERKSLVEFLSENYNIALSFTVPGLTAAFGIALRAIRSDYVWVGILASLIFLAYVLIGYLQNHNEYLIPTKTGPKSKIKITPSENGLTNPNIPRNRSIASKSYSFVQDNGQIKVKFCYTCKVFRPYLAVHCARCDECCLHFDHHCMWLKNCICRNNYKVFVGFLITLSLLSILTIVSSVLYLPVADSLGAIELVCLIVSIILAFVQLIFVAILMGFHVFLFAKGVNTYQYIKNRVRGEKSELGKTAEFGKENNDTINHAI